jgi:uncharacterized membrane protein YfcA
LLVTIERGLTGLAFGFVISVITTPVGVSGAVFLLPVQLSVLGVPNPSVTPTNLLFNVIAGPGALARFRSQRQFTGPLTRLLIAGTLPGVVIGAVLRVFVAPGPGAFHVLAGLVLLTLGLWLCARTWGRPVSKVAALPRRPVITGLALAVGLIGGIYGIGGGSILGPVLVGWGLPVASVAPAALASTFLTSLVGVSTFALLSIGAMGHVTADWPLGVACGLGGLLGGYVGAFLQPKLPERRLRLMLGLLAMALGLTYLGQAFG